MIYYIFPIEKVVRSFIYILYTSKYLEGGGRGGFMIVNKNLKKKKEARRRLNM